MGEAALPGDRSGLKVHRPAEAVLNNLGGSAAGLQAFLFNKAAQPGCRGWVGVSQDW